MENTTQTQFVNLNISHRKLRRNLGILGITLPVVLLAGDQQVAPSISHYYYTGMGVWFTGILWAFGLFLFTYKGYAKKDEKVSDNWVTNIAGLFAIITALIPTSYVDTDPDLTFGGPNAHTDHTLNTIHLIAAGLFLIIMGWMSFKRFTISGKGDVVAKRRWWFYKICGLGVWISLALIGLGIAANVELTGSDVFIGEFIALIFFGTAWLVKSKTLSKIGL